MQDVGSLRKGKVMKVNLVEHSAFPSLLYQSWFFLWMPKRGNCLLFIQVGPCAWPHCPSQFPCYWGCISTLFPVREKTGGPYCYHWRSLPPGGYPMFNPFNLYLTRMEGVGEMTYSSGCGNKAQFWVQMTSSRRKCVTPRGCPKAVKD